MVQYEHVPPDREFHEPGYVIWIAVSLPAGGASTLQWPGRACLPSRELGCNVYIYIYIYTLIHWYMCVYTYIYICIERERDRDIDMCICICAYIIVGPLARRTDVQVLRWELTEGDSYRCFNCENIQVGSWQKVKGMFRLP